jgi:hypothetical protein
MMTHHSVAIHAEDVFLRNSPADFGEYVFKMKSDLTLRGPVTIENLMLSWRKPSP